jgi:peroxiredoxin
MKELISGDKAPDFTLLTIEGETLRLYDVLQENDYVLLIFLRHLG